ncbi:unnamed protein product [Urochloa humidicola]
MIGKDGMFRLTIQNECLERLLKDLKGSYDALKANYDAIVQRYEELEAAATAVADSIDATPAGTHPQPLVDRLQELPKKFPMYVHNTCCFVTNHVLATVHSLHPNIKLDNIPGGKAKD